MWGVRLSPGSFVYSLFGIQFQDEHPNDRQSSLISQFDNLIKHAPTSVERLIQDGGASPNSGKTQVWIAYWKSHPDYQAWWTDPDVSAFWSSLPPDAGMWREIITPHSSRTQHGTNQTTPIGLGHLGDRIPVGDKTGYWGCYRHRMSAEASDRMKTPLQGALSRASAGALSSDCRTVRPGRVHMTRFPENICFVVEGQDHSHLTPEETECWFKHFDQLVTQWIVDLTAAPPESGILDARLCYYPEGGTFRDSAPAALNYNKKTQFFYFTDMNHMLRFGQQNKGHVQLRSDFMEAYWPGGPLSATGQIGLWVETSVLKEGELECEYVGCLEGTGFMPFDSMEGFT
ncbi:hypothetical protein ASPWEDRAFT_41707 [Aspergillus wentii DTO 134E9]|uniref:Hem-containing dehydratase protein n=1 Tax=Aspergillus wentii DTO 134E9 TaxID=1073089 RepID=A0A1L9RFX2_ASPWE|nr:uncharacterized protein ASPWEDRAFT_41707 [Aspergillus wentii DTO 134E9]KAI9925591.1 hypothetical protein MW887_005973 [Aspergillus wentii]OJJ33832.1 hypothetical protein ASPWEDRAFT_41707 [Aspergillus wentii DTO 134E9]